MKKSAKLKRKTIRMIVKNLIVFTVLIAVTAVGVRSWFVQRNHADAKGLNVSLSASEELEVAIVAPGRIPTASQWQKASEILLNGDNYDFLADMNMTQVTGDGINFIKPYLMQYGVVAAVDSESDWDQSKIQTTVNEDYLSFDFYMRTKTSSKTVELTEDTYCGPETLPVSYTDGTNVLPASAVGSLRVAVTDTASTRRLLWIPAPNIYYNYDHMEVDTATLKNTSNTLALQYMNGSTLTNVYSGDYTKGTYNHTYWTYSGTTKTHSRITYGSNKASNVTANNQCDYKLHDTVTIGTLSTPLTSLTGYSDSSLYGVYYYDKCRFNFWFEGEDPEARAAQVGGTFKAVLQLDLGNAS